MRLLKRLVVVSAAFVSSVTGAMAGGDLRGSIKRKECACPMANANYANMLLHPPTVAKVILDVAK